MIATAKLTSSFDRDNVFRFLDNTHNAEITLGVRTNTTLISLRDVSAGVAELHSLLHANERLNQTLNIFLLRRE